MDRGSEEADCKRLRNSLMIDHLAHSRLAVSLSLSHLTGRKDKRTRLPRECKHLIK